MRKHYFWFLMAAILFVGALMPVFVFKYGEREMVGFVVLAAFVAAASGFCVMAGFYHWFINGSGVKPYLKPGGEEEEILMGSSVSSPNFPQLEKTD